MSELPPPLRIVFFGPPASGKTRLLRAVAGVLGAGAEESPIDLVPVHLPLGEGGRSNEVRMGGGDVVTLQVLVDLPGPREVTGAVQLIDCESRAATELLEHPDELRRESARYELRETIRRADAMVMTIDATWDVPALRENLRQFRTFLRALEGGRTYDRESGGMPVFLVLTKCDALSRPEDSRTQWLSRLTIRQNEVLDQFNELFEEGPPDGGLEFGSLDLKVVPTAVEMPNGQGFGIDGLAIELLRSARENASRIAGTQRRLTATVGGLIALFAVLAGVLGWLNLIGPPGPLKQLELGIEEYRSHAASAEVRFADANFVANQRRMLAFLNSPEFPRLRPELQEYVQAMLAEFERYGEYRAKFQPPQFSPAEVRTTGEFQQLQIELASTLAPPLEYRDAWRSTQALQLYEKWKKDLKLLGTAEDQLHGWYRELIRRATKLMLVESPNAGWREESVALFREAANQPFPTDAAIPGSPRLGMRRGEPLTYEAAYRFERTESAERDWRFASQKLRNLADLCEALGMIPTYEGTTGALLEIPEGAPRTLAAERLMFLKLAGTEEGNGNRDWHVSQFPDPIRQELTRRLKLSRDRGIRQVQVWIAAELGGEETSTAWQRVSENLLVRPDIRAWGTLLQKLLQWGDQSAVNPVEELAEFVKKERFDWPVQGVELYLPNALRENALVPDGPFTITVTSTEGPPQVTLFREPKAVRSDSQGTTWRFTAARGEPIRYTPGEGFAVELKLRDGETNFTLSWLGGTSKVYRFDRIASEPTLIRDGPNAIPQKASGVKLTMLPESSAIRVPALLPALPGVK